MVRMPPEDDKNDVLSSLPRTRPQRRSARRDSARKPAAAAAAEPGAPAKTAAAAKPAAARKPAATRKPAAAKKPAAARKPAAKKAGSPRPRVQAVKPAIPPAGYAPPKDTQERGAPSGTELVGTAIQAAGELVQIGAAIGGQALKSALGR